MWYDNRFQENETVPVSKSVLKRTQVKYEIINKNQSGLLKRISSNDTVISLTESVNSSSEENDTVVSIFLELAKAFNSIFHKIFLEKITKHGLTTESIAMIESFFLQENNA